MIASRIGQPIARLERGSAMSSHMGADRTGWNHVSACPERKRLGAAFLLG